MPGRLLLLATPIGNLGDAPPRLAEALQSATVVYCEDTRRASQLLRHLGVSRPLTSYFVGNEAERADELERRLREGEVVALLTDAGTPAISDPGMTAVRAAQRAGATVSVVPGPSAATAALAVSGLPSERFSFEGFLPRKGSERRERLGEIAAERRTLVLFASPHRVAADLEDLAAVCGRERRVCVARELTKQFEEVWWGSLGEAAETWSRREHRGEFTLVLEGAAAAPGADVEAGRAAVRRLVEAGASRREAARVVSELTGISRRQLYEADLGEA